MNALESAGKAVELAAKEERAMGRKGDDASDALAAAEATYLETGTDKDLDALQRGRLKAERGKALHLKAVDALRGAEAKLRDEETAVDRADHVVAVSALTAQWDAFDPHFDRLVVLDAQLEELAIDLAKDTAKAQSAYDFALARAKRIGASLPVRRISLEDVLLMAARIATAERAKAGREDNSSLLADVIDDRATAEMAANDRERYLEHRARTEQADATVGVINHTLSLLAARPKVEEKAAE